HISNSSQTLLTRQIVREPRPPKDVAHSPPRCSYRPYCFVDNTTRSVGSGRMNAIGSKSERRSFQRAKSKPVISVCCQVGSTEIWERSALVTTQTAGVELLMK